MESKLQHRINKNGSRRRNSLIPVYNVDKDDLAPEKNIESATNGNEEDLHESESNLIIESKMVIKENETSNKTSLLELNEQSNKQLSM